MTDSQLMYTATMEAPPNTASKQAPAVVPYRDRLAYAFRPESRVPIYLGVGLCAVGFIVLGVGWLEVALLSDVWKQMPYLLSAGLPGIGLILVGLVTVNVSVRRQDGAATRRQLAEVAEAVRQSSEGRKRS